MWLPLLLLSQSTARPQQPRILIDLLPKPCTHPSEQAGEIVVCGRREEPYRIGPISPTPPALPEAKIGIGEDATLSAEARQGEIGGIPTNRAMLTLKVKF